MAERSKGQCWVKVEWRGVKVEGSDLHPLGNVFVCPDFNYLSPHANQAASTQTKVLARPTNSSRDKKAVIHCCQIHGASVQPLFLFISPRADL